MRLGRLSSITNVARFLDAPEETVMQLLEEGRLGGALVAALSSRGVAVTPNLKNSVATVVRTVSPEAGRAAPGRDNSYLLASDTTTTTMFTDIVGSSAITERLGDRTAREVLGAQSEIIRRQTRTHGGVEVKSMGDGFMLTFPSARAGVACAVAVQRELADYNREHTERQLALRMGLSVGEPVREEEDLFGNSVILAARISATARGGQVLVAQIVYTLAGGTGEFTFRELGGFELKGISSVHLLYEVVWRPS